MKTCWLLLLTLALSARAEQQLVFMAATNHAEPLSVWEKERLSGGLLKDLGDLMAAELGREARYLSRPSKRAPASLRDGEADLFCYVRPDWIGSDFHFSPTVIVNAYVIAAGAEAPALRELEDLRGQRVGTVLGYRYGDIATRGGFVRDDAPTMAANLRKLAAGHVRYALTDAITLRGMLAPSQPSKARLALVLEPFETACALSPRSSLAPAQLDAAVRSLQRSGRLQALLDRYR